MRDFSIKSLLFLLVFLCTGIAAHADGFETSSADAPKYYRIYSGRADHNTLTSHGVGQIMTGETTESSYSRGQLWRIEARTDDASTYNIVSMDGDYIDLASLSTSGVDNAGNKAFLPTAAAPSTGWSITATSTSGQYYIHNGSTQLHQGASGSSYYVINWGSGSNTSDTGCQFYFEEVTGDALTAAFTLSGVTVSPGTQGVAPGKTDQLLFQAAVSTTGITGTLTLDALGLTFSSETTNATQDITGLKVYASTGVTTDFYSKKSSLTALDATATITSDGATVTLASPYSLHSGTNYLYVAADISASAVVGDYIDAALSTLTYNTSETYTVSSGNPSGMACVYTQQHEVYKAYDENSKTWRIPAMVVLKHQSDATKNGRIVTMADMRFSHNSDLPNHIDVYETHSDDQGKTWSEKQCVAGTTADHQLVKYTSSTPGFGDAALVETLSGKLVAIMVAGNGFGNSTPSSPIETFIVTSTDAGETWSDPVSLYDVVYGTTYTEGTLNGTFAASGRGLVLQRQTDTSRNGRIMFAMSHRFSTGAYQEYIIYSDDEGATWKMSTQSAYSGGDESKLVELKDGTVMISVRQNGNRGFNTSTDGGITWGTQSTNSGINGNACNGDILYYSPRILVHSYVNNANRQNLTIAASLDNGQTWTKKRVVCAPSSAYSTLDITSDGELCLLYEDNACSSSYNLNYVKFPITFLVEGNPEQEAYETALATAKTMVEATGYENIVLATAGQYSQESLDALSALVNSTETVTDYDAAATALENAMAAAKATAAANVPGYTDDVLFTIRSYENCAANSSKPMYVSSAAAPEDATDETAAQWQFVATGTAGQCAIKLSTADTYLMRSGSTLTTTTSAMAWTVTKDASGNYYYLRGMHNSFTSYLVIDITSSSSSFNFWSSTAGSAQWSTKYVLTPVAKAGMDMTTHSMYTVTMANAPTDTYITVGETEAAADGGVLFLTAEQVANLSTVATAHVGSDYVPSYSVDESTKTITVTFAHNYLPELTEALAAAQAVLDIRGVGYPTTESDAYTTLQAAITAAAKLTTATADDVTTLTNAVTTYKAATTGIQMPEDGKAYTITSIGTTGARSYMNYTESGYTVVATSETDNSNYPMTAVLVCHKISDTEYTFANNAGKYFIWKGGRGGQNSNKGYSDAFTSGWTLNIMKMTKGTYVTIGTQADYFGYVVAQSNVVRTDNSTKGYFIIKNGTGYDQANAPFYRDVYSSALLIEETTYANTPQLNAAGLDGADYLATFSAPFPTLIPDGVTAYVVTEENDAAIATALEGTALPANTGVLLAATAGGTVTMVPAAAETQATVGTNLLLHTAGAAHEIESTDNAFILSKVNDVVAFYRAKVGTTLAMNRAYLPVSDGASTKAIRFDGGTTDIVKAETSAADAPVYDLSGRRVVQPQKGGLYIQGGKKFIKK